MVALLLLVSLASSALASAINTPFQYGTALSHDATAPISAETPFRRYGHRSIIRTCTDGHLTAPYPTPSGYQTRSYNPTATAPPLSNTALTLMLTTGRSPSSFATSVASQSTCSNKASPPAPTQPGVVSGCSEWYVAQPGDFCHTIANKFGISTDTFMAWNPAVNPRGCTDLLAGDAYCVQVCGDTSITSISTSFTPLSSSTASGPVPSSTLSSDDTYRAYCGDGSVSDGWPSEAQWLDFNTLFDNNTPNMKVSCENNWNVPNDSDEEIANLKSSIHQVEDISGIDARFILAIVMQESTGCVRVITTEYSHPNPGLMQSYDGSGTCNSNQAALGITGTSASNVLNPCPASEIYQMVLDGTNGTAAGPGLRQNFAQQGLSGSAGYYRTARVYNGGLSSLTANENNLENGCCTSSYVSDVANRLTGWVNAAREFTCS